MTIHERAQLIIAKVEILKIKSNDYIWSNSAHVEVVAELKSTLADIDDLLNRAKMLDKITGGPKV